MEEAFDWEPGLILPCEATLDSLRAAGEGGISLVLRKEALPAARLLHDRAGVPFLEGVPLGIHGTLDWLRRVGNAIGQEPSHDFTAQELSRLKALPVPALSGVCIVSGSSMAGALSRFFRQELHVSHCRAFAFEKQYLPSGQENTAPYSEEALDAWIAANRPELLMGNSVVTERDFGYPARRIAIRKPAGIPNQDPPETRGFLGWQGYRNLIDALQDGQ